MNQNFVRLMLFVLAVIIAAVAVSSLVPAAVQPADVAGDLFSADRAWSHLETIAQEPHPMGSAEHARVRQYLVDEIGKMGLQPEIQEATAVRPARLPWFLSGKVFNVAARLAGSGTGPAVLLVAHYDTVPSSPGAGDDGAGVVAMLEILRALRAGPPLDRDVLFLFTDGEEAGLLGAKAFVEQPIWDLQDIGMVINLEARGASGPALMFETSSGNSRLITALQSAVGRKTAASYGYEIYRRMPNDTDFTVFRQAGLSGFNFAFIHGATAYHTAQDSLARFDPRSLQDLGDSALALTRFFAGPEGLEIIEAEAEAEAAADAVYFNILGTRGLVAYQAFWVLPLALLGLLGWFVLWLRVKRRGDLTTSALLLSLLSHLVLGLVVAGLLFLMRSLLVGDGYSFDLWGSTSHAWVHLATLLVIVGLAFAAHRQLRTRHGDAHSLGGLLLWALVALAVALLAPGASYLFSLPLLFALAAGFAAGNESAPWTWLSLALAAVAVTVTLLLWSPALVMVSAGLPFMAPAVFGLLGMWLIGGPLNTLVAIGPPRWWISGLMAMGIVLCIGTHVSSDYSPENRRPTSLFYAHDHVAGDASWYGLDEQPGAWTQQFLGDSPEIAKRPDYLGWPVPVLRQSAPLSALEPAEVRVLAEEMTKEGRRLRLLVSWPYATQRAILLFEAEAGLQRLAVDGAALAAADDGSLGEVGAGGFAAVVHHAPAESGIRLEVELPADAELTLETVAHRYGLPQLEGFSVPRPADTMPAFGWTGDSTLVRSVEKFAPGVVIDGEPPAELPAELTAPEALGAAPAGEIDGETVGTHTPTAPSGETTAAPSNR